MEYITFYRKKLYEEIWKEPMYVVAKRYGISNVGLKKVCIRLNIPTPALGYWAKVKAGQKIEIPSLKGVGPEQASSRLDPDNSNGRKKNIEGKIKDQSIKKILEAYEDVAKDKEKYPDKKEYKDVVKSLTRRASCPIGVGYCSCIKISVTDDSKNRAVIIALLLYGTLKKLGHIKRKSNYVEIDGLKFSIWVKEHLRQTEHVLTEKELKEKEENRFFSPPVRELHPTNKFSIIVESVHANFKKKYGEYKVFKTKPNKKTEDCITDCIIGMYKALDYIKEYIEESKLMAMQQEEEQKRRIEIERLQREEMKKIEKLKSDAEDWHQYKKIMDYINAVDISIRTKKHSPIKRRELLEWVKWAKGKADWLNPLINKDDPILGRRKLED
ncbi:hypothetical protein RBH29_08670 [Herbivorax sp. ANBcel31]|uniref:hypothetical protein n=1 Tax=Herbivorax sp. ANBcel31 TaxID=3069754 RepID=UPI0027B85735|nr:hypothetical protein [Herbivorax sp. ANBcel31]MDQ2086499.1 hypothetical protein [Herbivorax sp. ANBcel31]